MKKILAGFLFTAFVLVNLLSCAETRKFKHEYYCLTLEPSGDKVIPTISDDGKCSYIPLPESPIIFSGGDDVGYFFDVESGKKLPVSSLIMDGGKIGGKFELVEGKAQFVTNIENCTDANISGEVGDRYVFDSWKVLVITKKKGEPETRELKTYSGTGCEDLTLYATYKKEK